MLDTTNKNNANGVATFVYPPYSVNEHNVHPIRIAQVNWSTMACPRDHYVILMAMQASGKDPSSVDKDIEVLKSICDRYYPDQVDFTLINAEK